jgi:predicted N-acetyltransferase YhbS
MQIEYLADNINYTETVADWIYTEFVKGIRDGITREHVFKSMQKSNKTELPIRLVAIESGRCVGTVSLVANDLKGRDYAPWLASLYVDSSCRGNGIGERLVERVKEIAKDLGYNELFLRTEHASDYYRRLKWQFVESCYDEHNLYPDVFKFVLLPNAGYRLQEVGN